MKRKVIFLKVVKHSYIFAEVISLMNYLTDCSNIVYRIT